MAADPRGSWFRVYSRAIRQHPKFKSLTHAELGAWLDLRAEVDLLDGSPFADEMEALHVLRRRSRNPIPLLRKLVAVQLVDVMDDGRHAIHDREDHDRPAYPSDEPESVRERQRRSRASRLVTNDVTSGHEQSREESREEKRVEPSAPATLPHLPAEDDSATYACRKLPDGGRWLADREYTAAWDDLDRRFSAEWVHASIADAYVELIGKGRVRAWDLKKAAEMGCAERSRLEERQRADEEQRREDQEADELRERTASMTDEERERQKLTRKAVGVWIRGGRKGSVPLDVAGLQSWLAQNGVPA